MWGLSSPTRDWTCVPCIARCSLTTGPPGKTLCCFLMSALKEARKDELYSSFHPDSPSMTSLFCPPLTPPPTMLLRPWLESSEASWQKCLYLAPTFSKTTHTSHNHCLAFFAFPPKNRIPRSWALRLPRPPHILRNFIITRWSCFLVSFWLWAKAPGCEAHPRAMWSRFLLTKGTARLCCGQSPEFIPLLTPAPRGRHFIAVGLRGGPSNKGQLGASLPGSEFRVFTLVTWNRPRKSLYILETSKWYGSGPLLSPRLPMQGSLVGELRRCVPRGN